jgi:TolA-binding protein
MPYNYTISCLALAAAMSLGPAAASAQTTQGATGNQTNTNQAQKQSTANTEAGACDRLIERLRAMQIDQRPIRLRQARQYRQNNNTGACQQSLQQVDQRAQSGNRSGEAAGGQITVQRAAPSVTVSRGQPEITIQQQGPVVTVEIPPPRVTVRMPEPDVKALWDTIPHSKISASLTVLFAAADSVAASILRLFSLHPLSRFCGHL